MDGSIISSLILGAVGIGVTCYYSWRTTQLARDQMMKDLFKEFNQRYALLNNSLLEIEMNYPTTEKFESAEEKERLGNAVIDFFILCAEEYYWFKHKGRLDPVVWYSWSKGMNYWYQNVPTIREMWQQEVANGGMESYYITDGVGFFRDKL